MLSALHFAAEPIRLSLFVVDRPQNGTHLARTLVLSLRDRERESEKERETRGRRIARPQVLSKDVAARISRCASRPDEFTHETGAPVRPRGFLGSRGADRAQFALHLLQIGLPSFLARAYAAERASSGFQRDLVSSIARRRADNPLRRMRRRWRSLTIGRVYSYVADLKEIDACWHIDRDARGCKIWATATLKYRMKASLPCYSVPRAPSDSVTRDMYGALSEFLRVRFDLKGNRRWVNTWGWFTQSGLSKLIFVLVE